MLGGALQCGSATRVCRVAPWHYTVKNTSKRTRTSTACTRSRQRHDTNVLVRRRSRPACAHAASVEEPGSQPTRPKALKLLYEMYLLTCLVERSWRFGLPLVLANIKGGFRTVALVGFFSPVAVALFGPLVGQMLDRTPRQAGLTVTAALQAVAIAAAGLVLLRAVQLGPGFAIQQSPLFILLLFFSMMERLCAFAADVAVERDWITQLAGKSNHLALAASNATLRRCDLMSELLGTFLFGYCVTQKGAAFTLGLLTICTACALPLELWYVQRIAKAAPDIMRAERSLPVDRRYLRPRAATHSLQGKYLLLMPLTKVRDQVQRTMGGWSLYLRQPILPASLAYILLMFNAVLSPGGLMTAFLASQGLTGTAAALFRGGCAVMGFVGTTVAKRLIAISGLLHAGIVATSFQAIMLGAAALIYHTKLASTTLPASTFRGVPTFTWIFCLLVILSRIGIWAFDIVDSQLFQMAVDPDEAASVSSVEVATANISELVMLGIAAVASEPRFFGMLVSLSSGAVITAAILYSCWANSRGAANMMARAMKGQAA